MKLIKVPRINALGKKGPESAPDLLCKGFEFSEIKVDNSNVEEAGKEVYEKAKEIFEKGSGLFVGGDHSISFPILKGFSEVCGDGFLIVFDAHADCMKPMKEPTHEEWLRGVIELGWNPENVVLIGARKIEEVERKFLRENGVKVFSSECNLEAMTDYVMEKARDKNVYVSIDIDVLEPAFAPAVNYPEPLGFSSLDFFYVLRRILHLPKIIGVDLVEIVPSIDKKYDFRTVGLGRKIIGEIIRI